MQWTHQQDECEGELWEAKISTSILPHMPLKEGFQPEEEAEEDVHGETSVKLSATLVIKKDI